jgi:hypothetical protein
MKETKPLKGVDGSDITLATPLLTETDAQQQPVSNDAQIPPSSKDIFSVLEISSTATVEEALKAINSKMRSLRTLQRSDERERMREQLRDWHDKLTSDPQFLERERQRLQLNTIPTTSTLLVDDHEVATISAFVHTCEQSEQGWQDGEMHLRSGELEHWVHPLTQNLALTREVTRATDSILPNFQALNDILYHFLPERPFRLYQQERWQPLHALVSIPTVKQLAALCDQHWDLITQHLYYGSLLTWLEQSPRCPDIRKCYASSISQYAHRGHIYQSLGLELLLEHIAPTLPRPEVVFTFDGSNGSYTLLHWDKELAHQPVEVLMYNHTRGATIVSVELEIENSAPDWITLSGSQSGARRGANNERSLSPLYNRPGEQNPIRFPIFLQNFQQMEHGQTWHGKLRVNTYTSNDQSSVTREYPLTLSTMEYRQGFRWHLWNWGLRGGWPGLVRNFLAGVAVSLIFFLLIIAFVRVPSPLESNSFLSSAFQAGILGTISMISSFLSYKFVLFTGALAGVIGSVIGWKKGYADYSDKQNARNYMTAGFWSSLVSISLLLYASWGYHIAASYGLLLDDHWLRFAQIAGCLLVGLLMYLSIWVLSLMRRLVEQRLRRNYSSLLKPQGSVN